MTKQTEQAIDKFTSIHNDIQDMIKQLQSLSDNHFNKEADNIDWADVGDAGNIARSLEYALLMTGDLKEEDAKYN